MRPFALLVIAACTAPPVVAAPTRARVLEGFVIDPHGPVAGAELRAMSLPPRACPCTEADLATASPMNALPDCQCPAALAMWQDELAHCDVPVPLTTAQSDANGHVAMVLARGTTTVAALTPTGERWVRLPAAQTPIALELATLVSPHVTLATRDPALRGALLFPDGHCTRLARVRDGFTAEQPVPFGEATLVFASPSGVAVHRWSGEPELAVDYHPSITAHEMCGAPNELVTYDSPFQHLKTRADATGAFHFNNVLGFDGTATCTTSGSQFYLQPGDNLVGAISDIGTSDPCLDVEVVDPQGRPVEDASVSAMVSLGANSATGHTTRTDAHGRTCVDIYADTLIADVPATLGGSCAGHDEHKVSHTGTPPVPGHAVRLTLHTQALHRAAWTGRVVSPERLPVADALVRVATIYPRRMPGCSATVNFDLHTRIDGTFTLPLYPDGRATLEIAHDWYSPSNHDITIEGPARDLVVDRGASWTGRVLDPDGHPFEHCTIYIEHKTETYIKAVPCTPGFAFAALPPGNFEVRVRVERGSLGSRSLEQTVHIDPRVHRTLDVTFPRGASIAGTVIDAAGTPIPNARVDAIPKGSRRHEDRLAEGEVQLAADASGHFELRHLTPGMWVLRGNKPTLAGHDIEIATGTTDVRLVVAK